MKEIHTEIEIHAPAERVWQVLTDFAAYPQWNSFIRRVEGEIRAGARLHTFPALPCDRCGPGWAPVEGHGSPACPRPSQHIIDPGWGWMQDRYPGHRSTTEDLI